LLFRAHRGLDRAGGISATTAATTAVSAATAATAAIATTIASAAIAAAMATMMTSVMAAATAAAMMASMAAATTAATAAATAATAAAVAAAAKDEGRSLLLTAHEGDTDEREKHRETKNNNTVHPRILQLLTGTGKRELPIAVNTDPSATADGSASRCDLASARPFLHQPEAVPVVNFYGLRRM
jgi:hypothetical protein